MKGMKGGNDGQNEGKPEVRTERNDKAKDAGKQFNNHSMVKLMSMSKDISLLKQTAVHHAPSHVV